MKVSFALRRCRQGSLVTGRTALHQQCATITTTPLTRVTLADNKNNNSDEECLIADLLRPYYDSQTPVILENYARAWPAVSQWTNWDYLRQRVGEDWLCDVEMGAYNNNNNNERLSIPFGGFIDYLTLYREQRQSGQEGENEAEESSPILYLAQNDLPHGLYEDIVLPPFLKANDNNFGSVKTSSTSSPSDDDSPTLLGQGKLYQCMIWMGPPRAESPLHFDPLDNLLVQIAGTKHVALLDRKMPRETLQVGAAYGQQENTSALPMRALLHAESASSSSFAGHGETKDLRFLSGILGPGDALFIPSKWWHYLESPTDFTISVNVWWR